MNMSINIIRPVTSMNVIDYNYDYQHDYDNDYNYNYDYYIY